PTQQSPAGVEHSRHPRRDRPDNLRRGQRQRLSSASASPVGQLWSRPSFPICLQRTSSTFHSKLRAPTMTYKTILFDRDSHDKFAVLTLNRPDKLKALNSDLSEELDTALAQAVKDPDINALVLTGAGRAFTTGYD